MMPAQSLTEDQIKRLRKAGAITERTAEMAQQPRNRVEVGPVQMGEPPPRVTVGEVQMGEPPPRVRIGQVEMGEQRPRVTVGPVQMDSSFPSDADVYPTTDYNIVSRIGGRMPGWVLDRGGKRYFEPHYGPSAGQEIEMGPGATLAGVRQFAAGEQAPSAADQHEVITELGGDMPGVVTQRAGRRYFTPGYGPLEGQPIEVGPGAGISEVQQFAMGPPGTTRPPAPDVPVPPVMISGGGRLVNPRPSAAQPVVISGGGRLVPAPTRAPVIADASALANALARRGG